MATSLRYGPLVLRTISYGGLHLSAEAHKRILELTEQARLAPLLGFYACLAAVKVQRKASQTYTIRLQHVERAWPQFLASLVLDPDLKVPKRSRRRAAPTAAQRPVQSAQRGKKR